MADELKHLTVGTILSQAEYEAIGGHVFDSQAQGDILYASSTSQLSRLGKDANATRALTNTGTNNNPVWAQIALATGVSGTLPVGNGGTGATTLTDKAVLISQDSGTDTLGSVALTTSGQVIIGGSSGPAAATLTAGSNITITNGDGSISIAAAAGGAALTGSTDNTIVTVTGSDTMQGEANLTFDGTDLTLASGSLILSTSGKGIDFSATANTGETGSAMVSELLDDYEEGTWTPRITDTDDNTGWTGDIKNGFYTKIGNVVFFRCNIRSTSLGGLNTANAAHIEGLPFTAAAGEHLVDVSYGINLAIAAGNNIGGYVDASDVRITLALWDATGGSTTMTLAEISANGSLTVGGFYHT